MPSPESTKSGPELSATFHNEERANAMLRESFAGHEQFSLMDEEESESLKRDLHPFAGSLDASRVNSGAARRENFGGVDADVVLRSGLRTETFTGINKETGEIGQGVKVICWTEYMVIGDDDVTKGSFETTNIFASQELRSPPHSTSRSAPPTRGSAWRASGWRRS